MRDASVDLVVTSPPYCMGKVVSFYMDPERLIEVAYSLRRDSWMDKEGLYQRILSPSKIRNMRAFLVNEGHVYVNNIILGLPGEVRITDVKDRDIQLETLKKVEVVKVHLPAKFNSVGLIDGQHRVYSYHEGTDAHEKIIKGKRPMQQLLVTGLIFPKNLDPDEKLKKEAKIFLEINAEQTSAKAELKQAIETIVRPFSRAHSVTMINGLVYCTRRLLQENRLLADMNGYSRAFASHGLDLRKGKFRFKSSQWKSLGDQLAKQCFNLESAAEAIG